MWFFKFYIEKGFVRVSVLPNPVLFPFAGTANNLYLVCQGHLISVAAEVFVLVCLRLGSARENTLLS